MRYVRKNIKKMKGYVPGEQPGKKGFIKLNTNENPYPPSPRVLSAISLAANDDIRLYPEPQHSPLIKAASKTYGVPEECIIAGNGSDELLSVLTRVFVGEGDGVAFPEPTYTLYDTLVNIQGGKIVTIPFPDDYSLPEGIESSRARLAFIANPNSPSGTFIPVRDLKKFAGRFRGVAVIDEAYVDFADENALPLINGLDNVVILRTLSKSFSLAGIRLGLAFAPPWIIEEMRKVKDSYNLNSLTIAAGKAALTHLPWMRKNVRKVRKTRERLTGALRNFGFEVFPSKANFVLARIRGKDLAWLYEHLKKERILVRYFPNRRLSDSLRITVGREEEVTALINALGRALAGKDF